MKGNSETADEGKLLNFHLGGERGSQRAQNLTHDFHEANMVADKSRGRSHSFLGHILVLRDVLALVLTLFFNGSQVLLIVVDLV